MKNFTVSAFEKVKLSSINLNGLGSFLNHPGFEQYVESRYSGIPRSEMRRNSKIFCMDPPEGAIAENPIPRGGVIAESPIRGEGGSDFLAFDRIL